MAKKKKASSAKDKAPKVDWKKVAHLMLTSRAMDEKEENELVPNKDVLYQFSARGHELGQILLGSRLNNKHDAASAYYRSRPLLLSLGLSEEDAMAAPMGKSGGYSDGRDIGVVCNKPDSDAPKVLPMAGDVGSQYTPAIGWAQGIEYRRNVLGEKEYEKAISVILGGDGSVATNGFWSALTIATTQNLPVLFYIEDNGYGISVTSEYQTPGGIISNNLRSFKNLKIYDGDGTDPVEASELLDESVNYVRDRKGPALIRLTVPRLNGHSYQDNQAYKDEELLKKEQEKDPLKKLKAFMVPDHITERTWKNWEKKAKETIEEATEAALQRDEPDASKTEKFAFAEDEVQTIGGLAPEGHEFPKGSEKPKPEKQRINIVEAIRRTLRHELDTNPKLMVFGEDVGMKGGVHAATMDLQSQFGEDRVFDTSLSEEGIIGRAVGLAYSGLMPVAEIQFRKYADPATEQLNNCGTTRWRTANRFAAPIVVRMPGGHAKCGDPWHSMSNEVFFTHAIGWQLAMPSNAEDAVGLLRSAMRSNNPTIFFEHRNLLDAKYARKPYPGDEFVVPFGKARKLHEGDDLTIVTWGAMCERCEEAVDETGVSADILDLRTLMPWDKEAVLESIQRTNRCIIVHEDNRTAGFGAEIAAVLVREAFTYLDAPVERLTMPDIPVPYNVGLMESVLPTKAKIADAINELMSF
ncbi:transketolase C-terminal domain-containing protein [Gracilimonas mengyeensis]|uniref:3-methyl-2-oxobutanoate dehydrogenase (2-methylpropanoyl-transferring) n=1 Tax=Gracilimonas mengyeensis TaxID=1302730 RepID=A0A521B4K5_9BACT|nr:transketolase C-terminal domain-containing protein [Gracilimonas mengyeensis]SMO41999.1 2-oxoisovalerate dehydrogenase E1 component [Gracilimonas mengyeensis]